MNKKDKLFFDICAYLLIIIAIIMLWKSVRNLFTLLHFYVFNENPSFLFSLLILLIPFFLAYMGIRILKRKFKNPKIYLISSIIFILMGIIFYLLVTKTIFIWITSLGIDLKYGFALYSKMYKSLCIVGGLVILLIYLKIIKTLKK